MKCQNCGFQNQEGDEFCGSCGQFLEWTGQPAADDVAAPPDQPAADAAAAPPPPPPPPPAPAAAASTTPSAPQPSPSPTAPPPPPEKWTTSQQASAALGVNASLPSNLVRCTTCGRANQATRAFCQFCGAKLSAAGAAGARGGTTDDGSSGRRVLIGGAAAIALLLVLALIAVYAGWIKLPGGTASATATPTGALPSGSPLVSLTPTPTDSLPPATPTASAGQPTDSPTAPTTAPPVETPTVAPPTVAPPTPPPPSPTPSRPPPTGYSCDPQTLSAPAAARWTLATITSGTRAPYDSFILNLVRSGASAGTVVVDAELVAPEQVPVLYGVDAPAAGDIALVVVVHQPVKVSVELDKLPDYRSLESFYDVGTSDGAIAVLGVSGSGCFNLHQVGWDDPASTSASVIVDITNR